MLSRQASLCSHFGHREGGVINDSSRGNRQTTTFKKLPMLAPSAKKKQMKMRCWGFKVFQKARRHGGTKARRHGGRKYSESHEGTRPRKVKMHVSSFAVSLPVLRLR